MSAKEMRKLMEDVNPMGMPAPQGMDMPAPEANDVSSTAGYVGDEMANETAELDILDTLQEEFKRIAAEYLQADGPLDEAGLSDVRDKMGKFMTSILDLLHDGWMDNMMDSGGSDEGSETPFGSSDDSDKDDSGDSDDSDSDDNEKEEKDSDDDKDDDKEEKDSDDDSDDGDDGDDKEKSSNNPFSYS